MPVTDDRFRCMASEVQVIAVDAEPDALGEVQQYLHRLERLWSRFLADSDVTRLNHAGGRREHVSEDTFTLLEAMRNAHLATGGRYDPTLLRAIVALGYDRSVDDPAARTSLPPIRLSLGDPEAMELDRATSTARLPAGMAIDPGGIGKGLAADLAAARLLELGARGALVSIGGDLAARGVPPAPDGWLVHVGAPENEQVLCSLALDQGGVATSNTRSGRWLRNGQRGHHLIDPLTGLPSDGDLVAATVIAPAGWLAEAHATASLLVGSSEVEDYWRTVGVHGLAVAADGSIRSNVLREVTA